MAKAVTRVLKLQIPAGKATPAPPLGPTLGQVGVNIGEFTTRFNDATREMMGDKVSVVLSVFDDRTFDFIVKTPPTSSLILKSLNIPKGSGKNLTSKVGTLSKAQVKEIAERKMPDINANDLDAASKIVEGTARSMGVEVK
jgi:large subunit ribosomal protein L11